MVYRMVALSPRRVSEPGALWAGDGAKLYEGMKVGAVSLRLQFDSSLVQANSALERGARRPKRRL